MAMLNNQMVYQNIPKPPFGIWVSIARAGFWRCSLVQSQSNFGLCVAPNRLAWPRVRLGNDHYTKSHGLCCTQLRSSSICHVSDVSPKKMAKQILVKVIEEVPIFFLSGTVCHQMIGGGEPQKSTSANETAARKGFNQSVAAKTSKTLNDQWDFNGFLSINIWRSHWILLGAVEHEFYDFPIILGMEFHHPNWL